MAMKIFGNHLTAMAPASPRNMKVLSTAVATASVRGCVVRASSPDCSSPDAARPGWPDYALSRKIRQLNRAQRGIRNFCDTLRPMPSTLSARPVSNTKSTPRLCSNSNLAKWNQIPDDLRGRP